MGTRMYLICHINIAGSVNGDIEGSQELPTSGISEPPSREFARTIKFLDATMVFVCQVDIAGSIYCNAGRGGRRQEFAIYQSPESNFVR